MANIAYNGGHAEGFIWDPISGRSALPNRPEGYTVHITAVRASDIYGPGKGPGGTYAHYHMPRSGKGRQHQELHHKAYADLMDNGETIAAETEGVPGDHMTEDQLNAHARAFADAVLHRGVANRIATPDDTRGLRWHRLGCLGNFGKYDRNDPTTWSGAQTGERWTTHYGKTCPTDNFIRQIPEIYKRAQEYIKAGGAPQGDWLDMADIDDVKKAVREVLTEDWVSVGGATGKRYSDGKAAPYSLIRDGAYVRDNLDDLFSKKFPIYGALKSYTESDDMTVASMIRYAATAMPDGRNQYARLRADLATVKAAVGGKDVSAEAVAKELAPLLLDDLEATVAAAVEASESRSAGEIAKAVVVEMGQRLNPTPED